jgi:serine protease Do
MKKYFLSAACFSMLLLGTLAVSAQDKDKVKEEKSEKSKSSSNDEIIIKRKNTSKDVKVVVEVKDGEVIVNGKPIEDFDDDNIAVIKRRVPRVAMATPSSQFRTYGLNHDGDVYAVSGNAAFLGVSTDEDDGGAKITNVTEGSGADKAGLKEDDVITKINDTKIEDPSDLTKAIGKYKPEDKVTVTYKRDGKEQKATATLGKNKNSYSYSYTMPKGTLAPFEPDFNFNWNDDMHGLTYAFGGRPRLGIRAQDTEDGKGVKVLDVADESAAEKSGIKKDDIITDFDGKKINSADDLAEAAQDAREKTSVTVKLTRAGKPQTLELKRPKKLKTTNL